MTAKMCKRCGRSKPLADYHTRWFAPDGHKDVCKPCWRTLGPPERACYIAETQEVERGRNAALRAASPGAGWASSYRSRCRAYGIPPVVEEFTRDDVVARWGDACMDCGGPFEHLDHVVPVSAGGHHVVENCQPVCRRDNRVRWDAYRAQLDAAAA